MASPTIPPAHPLFREVMVYAFERPEQDALEASPSRQLPPDRLQPALEAAARNGWRGAIEELAAQPPPKPQLHFDPALNNAALGGHVEAMKEARKWGAQSNDMALACAAYGGHLAAMLLARGWGAKHNDSALVEAAVGGEIEAMHLLREWGARDYANAQHYATPEAWALLAAWIQEERSRIA